MIDQRCETGTSTRVLAYVTCPTMFAATPALTGGFSAAFGSGPRGPSRPDAVSSMGAVRSARAVPVNDVAPRIDVAAIRPRDRLMRGRRQQRMFRRVLRSRGRDTTTRL